MIYYCNDCGAGFNPRTVSESHPDGVGRCPSCIHEAGDCPRFFELNCDQCRDNHEAGHPRMNGGTSPYCQGCTIFKSA